MWLLTQMRLFLFHAAAFAQPSCKNTWADWLFNKLQWSFFQLDRLHWFPLFHGGWTPLVPFQQVMLKVLEEESVYYYICTYPETCSIFINTLNKVWNYIHWYLKSGSLYTYKTTLILSLNNWTIKCTLLWMFCKRVPVWLSSPYSGKNVTPINLTNLCSLTQSAMPTSATFQYTSVERGK